MLVMFESGRLGNQVFQYAALTRMARPGERIDLFGFQALSDTFTGLQAHTHVIEGRLVRHGSSFDVDRVARWIPGVAAVGDGSGAEVPDRPRGWCILVRPSWFQSPAVLDSPGLARIEFRPEILQHARSLLAREGLSSTPLAFLNVRGTDYRTWPSVEHPAILTPEWYRAQIDVIRARHPEVHVIALGDDPDYINEVSSGVERCTTVGGSASVDLALMSLCSAGVLSASTFAYWGAYFATRNGSAGPFIAPDRWVGHTTTDWYPPHIKSDFLEYR
mgnify:CR=1 FL=1